MALLVIKATDYRLDLPQIACMQAMNKFLENLKPMNTFLCFTHCDKHTIDDEFIKEKVNSLKKFGKIEIPEENVILFRKNMKSLESFVANMVRGNIKLVQNLDEALEQFDNDLP